MKRIVSFLLSLLLLTSATWAASAPHAPESVTVQNLNGRQMVVKVYELAPGEDPAALVEDPFDLYGYHYASPEVTKEEHTYEDRKTVTEAVSVETATGDTAAILTALDAMRPYDDGVYRGTLTLDHTSLHTEASGYATRSDTVTEVKRIGGLDRNDPSYVPASTVKDGHTLALTDVAWSVDGTSLADGVLVPTTYTATATYSGTAYRKVATGYTTTVNYTGEVVSGGVSSVTYTVTYLGEPIPPEPAPVPVMAYVMGAAVLIVTILLVLSVLLRSNVKIFVIPEDGVEYTLAGKQRISRRRLVIDLRDLTPPPVTEAVIEIRPKTARRLFGRLITIRLDGFNCTHLIEQGEDGSYWFTVSTLPDPTGPEQEERT